MRTHAPPPNVLSRCWSLRPLEGSATCCGFGGTFCVKYPAISNAIVEEKAQAIEATGAGLLLGGDLDCLVNMAGKLHRRGHARLPRGRDPRQHGWWYGDRRNRMSAHVRPGGFDTRVQAALANPLLKIAIDRTTGTARAKRAAAVAARPGFAAGRDLGRDIKDHVIDNLDHYPVEFECNALAPGAKIHWVRTGQEACDIVVAICRDAGACTVTRAKSVLGEEIGLPHALEVAGIEQVETDLAEHIIQLAGDPPSHIVWPALHKTRRQVAALFRSHHHDPGALARVEEMVASARRELRGRFSAADVGISGANFLIADTGAVCTVTNEACGEEMKWISNRLWTNNLGRP